MNEAIVKALGKAKELHVMKGLLMNISKAAKQETGEVYYTFDLKVLKHFGEDEEYGQTYNLYNVIMPVEVAKHYNEADIKGFKDSEVLAVCSTRASVKRFPPKEDGSQNKCNNISLYLVSMDKTRQVTFTA